MNKKETSVSEQTRTFGGKSKFNILADIGEDRITGDIEILKRKIKEISGGKRSHDKAQKRIVKGQKTRNRSDLQKTQTLRGTSKGKET